MRLAKYTKTPVGYYLELPIGEFYEWIKVMNAEIKRETRELEKIKKKRR